MEFDADDQLLRVLRCGHAEHAECIDQWLAVNKNCPLCQQEILPSVSPTKRPSEETVEDTPGSGQSAASLARDVANQPSLFAQALSERQPHSE